MRKISKNKKGVSEVIGVAILLGMAISLFTIVQIMAINMDFNTPAPLVRLTATIDNGTIIDPTDTIILYHQGGESLPLKTTKIIFSIEGYSEFPVQTAYDLTDASSKSNGAWNIGEKLLYNSTVESSLPPELTGLEVKITVIDGVSNSVIMQGTVRGG